MATTPTGYVDPTYGAAPAPAPGTGGGFSLDPQKGWVAMPSTPSPNAGQSPGVIMGALKDQGMQFTNYNGDQTRIDSGIYDSLNGDLASYNAARAAAGQGGPMSAFEFDKMTNPTSYGARWSADGTQLTYDASGNPSGTQAPALPHGTTYPGQGTTFDPMNPSVNGTAAGQQANTTLGLNPDGTPRSPGVVAGARGGRNGPGASGAAPGSPGYNAWNVTPEQTVEGRIQSIINGGSPLVASARAGAIDQMNARGLTDSSLATSASDTAAYQAAIPIAQQDAATAAKSAGYNADVQNQMSMQQRQLSSQQQIAQLNSETQKYVAGLDASTRAQVQQMQNDNSKLIQTNAQAASVFNQAVAAVSAVQGNDKMDAAAKTQAISQIWANVQNQFTSMSTVSGLNLNLNLKQYPGFDAQGNFVGFNPDGSTKGGPPAAPAPAAGEVPSAAPTPTQ